jgi:hypothetical protein
MDKRWYKSWTIWLNLAGGIAVGALGVLGGAGFSQEQWFVVLFAAANFLLRFKTTQPIAIR